MNKIYISFAFSFMIHIAYVRCDGNCQQNETYLECGTCNKTCYDIPDNLGCTKECHPPGCYCKSGFYRKSEFARECVEKSECPVCDENQRYLTCGTACPDYCGKPVNLTVCTLECVSGCFCKPGYVKKSQNSTECVEENTCSERGCDDNQIYSECGSACPDYCGRNGSTICQALCVPGCICQEGYVRQSKNSTECVKETTCPERKCGKNEVYNSCGSSCPDYCGKLAGTVCSQGCKAGCICKDGYIRKSNRCKKCIPIEQCNIL